MLYYIMQQWFIYALIAAVFIGVKDLMTKDLTSRYSYIEYIIVANIMVFGFTIAYIFTMKPKLKRPTAKDGLFMALKHCDNPGYAKSISNLNTLVAFVLGIFILHNDFEIKNLIGIGLIVGGSLLIY